MVPWLVLLLGVAPEPAAAAPPPSVSFDEPEPDPDPRPRVAPPRQPANTLRIHASEPGAELAVRAAAPGWSGACAGLVMVDHPCTISSVPEQQVVDLRISGTRTFESKVLVDKGTTTVVIQHRGYGATVAGLVLFAASIGILAEGVSPFQSGDQGTGRVLIEIGASAEVAGLILILADLTGTHNHAAATQ